ncbi:MAG: DUF1549 domain-containing protein [Pirellulaceae bacterium]
MRARIACLFLLTTVAPPASGEEGLLLHQRVDQLITSAQGDLARLASPRCSDEEFLRRIFLDLAGRIPGHEEARQFLADEDPLKREQLLDRLLASPRHARHLQHQLDVMLMQRLPKKHVEPAQWQDYLYTSVLENKPWNQLAEEILTADGADEKQRPRARFLLARDLNFDDITRDIGRIFLGRDMQCAQCHDHPSIEDYLQRHYYGLTAYLKRSYLFKHPKSGTTAIGEKAEGDIKFTSVFTNEEDSTAPRLLDLSVIEDPEPAAEPYVTKPDKDNRGIPRYSRRLQLAPSIISPENEDFRVNIANRTWALVMGRGLVEPLDMRHASNPPSHPELLQLLADELLANGYDLRVLIRQLVLSETYQRSSQQVETDQDLPDRAYLSAELKPLSAEQLAWSTMQAVGLVASSQGEQLVTLKKEDPAFNLEDREMAVKLEKAVNAALAPHVEMFVGIFANQTDAFSATASQALFLENSELISAWLTPADGNLVERLSDTEKLETVAGHLYLALLSRPPTSGEQENIVVFLQQFDSERQAGIAQATRAILCSAEFRFNH